MIYVVAHDGGCEGYSLPVLAFDDREAAVRWVKAQAESYSIAAVPVYPEIPLKPWFQLEAETVNG